MFSLCFIQSFTIICAQNNEIYWVNHRRIFDCIFPIQKNNTNICFSQYSVIWYWRPLEYKDCALSYDRPSMFKLTLCWFFYTKVLKWTSFAYDDLVNEIGIEVLLQWLYMYKYRLVHSLHPTFQKEQPNSIWIPLKPSLDVVDKYKNIL